MKKELDILRIVADNPSVSQRKISEQTGISLGQVNFLIKKCVRKGLIKIDGQTSKSIRYNLTPKGLSEKASRTLHYIKVSYGAVLALTEKIRTLINKYVLEGYDIYIYGSQDELMEIIKLAVGNHNVNFIISNENTSQNEIFSVPRENTIIFYWEDAKAAELEPYNTVNILE